MQPFSGQPASSCSSAGATNDHLNAGRIDDTAAQPQPRLQTRPADEPAHLWPAQPAPASPGPTATRNEQLVEEHGASALSAAAWGGHSAVVAALIAAGVDPNHCATDDGKTALMLAAAMGHRDVFERLLKVPGIDLGRTDEDGDNALILAARNSTTGCGNSASSCWRRKRRRPTSREGARDWEPS